MTNILIVKFGWIPTETGSILKFSSHKPGPIRPHINENEGIVLRVDIRNPPGSFEQSSWTNNRR